MINTTQNNYKFNLGRSEPTVRTTVRQISVWFSRTKNTFKMSCVLNPLLKDCTNAFEII